MIIQAAPQHKFVHKKAMIILPAVTYQFHKIGMLQLSKIVDFCLYVIKKHIIRYITQQSI